MRDQQGDGIVPPPSVGSVSGVGAALLPRVAAAAALPSACAVREEPVLPSACAVRSHRWDAEDVELAPSVPAVPLPVVATAAAFLSACAVLALAKSPVVMGSVESARAI